MWYSALKKILIQFNCIRWLCMEMAVESKPNANPFYIVHLFDSVKTTCSILYSNETEKKDSTFTVHKKNQSVYWCCTFIAEKNSV